MMVPWYYIPISLMLGCLFGFIVLGLFAGRERN